MPANGNPANFAKHSTMPGIPETSTKEAIEVLELDPNKPTLRTYEFFLFEKMSGVRILTMFISLKKITDGSRLSL